MLIPFSIAFLSYAFSAYMSYWTELKTSVWFYPIGLANALFANAIWLYIAQVTSDKTQVFKYGFTWDGMRMIAYAAIPIMLLGVDVTPQKVFAASLIAIGMVLLNT